MDQHLISNHYDEIAKNVKILSEDVQWLKRQSDLIGTLSDTHEFRKPLRNKLKSVHSVVMRTRSKLQKAKDEGLLMKYAKWAKLNQKFFSEFDRLNNVSSIISTKLHKHPRKGSSMASDNDQLLTNTSSGYGATTMNQYQQQEQDMFVPLTEEIYEMENFEEQMYEIVDNLKELYSAQRDLNDLVYDMDEPINLLVEHVESANDNVQSGAQNIEKASEHLKSYRGKLCGVLIALLIIAIIITVIVVPKGKKK